MSKKELSSVQVTILVEVTKRSEVKLTGKQWDEIAAVVGAKSGRSVAERYRQLMASLKEDSGNDNDDGDGDMNDGEPTTPKLPKTPKGTKGKEGRTPGSGKRTANGDSVKTIGKAKKIKVENQPGKGDDTTVEAKEDENVDNDDSNRSDDNA